MEETILPPWDVLFDALFYSNKLNPRRNPNGKWPLGVSVRPASFSNKYPLSMLSKQEEEKSELPQSVVNALNEFTSTESMRMHLPLINAESVILSTVHAAWNSNLGNATGLREPCHIPVSTVEHENEQLVWGRTSKQFPNVKLPLCKWEMDCSALSLGDNQGPLPLYLSVSEQEMFDKTGNVPENSHFCLLCVRRDAQVLCLVNQKAVTNSGVQTGRGFFAVPPFQNLVDVMGGYCRSSLGVCATEQMVMPVNIVGVSGTLQVRYNPFKNVFYIDQGSIVYGSTGSLNSQAAI